MATVDTLLVRIEADMSDLRRGLKRVEHDVQRTTNKASASFKKLGGAFKLIAAAVVVRQAVVAGKAMINLSSDIEEMQGKSKVVFGKFRNGVVRELTAFGDAVGRSSFELEGMASTVQDTFVPMGFARGEAAKLSVELTKLAVDTASFNNASDTETMNAFQSALVGNHETVRRFGVVITEATLNQELLNMGIKDGAKAATNAQKVQARLNLITNGVTDAHGDAARTAGSFANQTKALFAALTELAAGIMENVLPAATKIVFALTKSAEAAKEFLTQMGLISEAPELKAKRKIKELDELELTLKNAKNELLSMGSAIQNAPQFEQSMGSTYIGAANVGNPDALRNRHLADQAKLVEKVREERDKLLITMKHDAEMQFIPLAKDEKSSDPDAPARAKQRIEAAALLKLTKEQSEAELHLHTAKMGRNSEEIKMERGAIIHAKLRERFTLMAPKNLAELTMATLNAEIAQENYNEALDAQNRGIESGVAFVDSMATEKEKLIELQRDLTEAHHHGAITTDELNAAHKRLAEELLLLDPIYANLVDMSNQAFDKMSNDLADMAMSGKFSLDTLKDTFKNTMKEMVREAIKTYIIKQMLSSMFAGIGGAIGGPVGGFIGKIGNSASGGSLSAGQPQIVGERGAELIVPKSASTVLNHHNTKNAMSGGNGTVVNQTINVDAGVSQTVRAEMLNLLPRIKQDTLNAVIDSKNRGGSFSKAFA